MRIFSSTLLLTALLLPGLVAPSLTLAQESAERGCPAELSSDECAARRLYNAQRARDVENPPIYKRIKTTFETILPFLPIDRWFPDLPKINSFEKTPGGLLSGLSNDNWRAAFNLDWSIRDVTTCTLVRTSPNTATLLADSYQRSYQESVEISPSRSATITYELTCQSSQGYEPITETLTIDVGEAFSDFPQEPEITSFDASATRTQGGRSYRVNFAWDGNGLGTCTIGRDQPSPATITSTSINQRTATDPNPPQTNQTLTYRLTCAGRGDYSQDTTTIAVDPLQPEPRITSFNVAVNRTHINFWILNFWIFTIKMAWEDNDVSNCTLTRSGFINRTLEKNSGTQTSSDFFVRGGKDSVQTFTYDLYCGTAHARRSVRL